MGTRTITIDFEGDLDAFAKQVQIDYATVLKRVCFDLFGRIVMKTPVDTGRARASWNISIGEPDSTVAPEGQQPAMNTWIAEAKAATALATLTERAVFSEPIWIANNLPYIGILEDGRRGNKGSRQAPNGMVKLSMQEVMVKMNLLTKVR